MFFNGLPEMPIRNVQIKNAIITNAKQGVIISQTENVTIQNVKVEIKGNTLQINNSKYEEINGRTYNNPSRKTLNIDL